jgi:cytoskeleton protein RodZ
MSVGASLKAARTELAISVEKVAAKLRVRPRIIEDIELDNYKTSGGATYARGHIKTLAQLYGMDVESLLSDFDASLVVDETSMSELLEEMKTPKEKSAPSWKIFGAVASLAILGILGYQVLPGNFSSSDPQVITASSPTSESNDFEAPAVASATKGVTLLLAASNGTSWVKVDGADGRTIFEGKLRTGQSQQFFDSQLIRVVIGNAGAINITYNGEDLGTSGRIGEVLRLEFTPEANSAG